MGGEGRGEEGGAGGEGREGWTVFVDRPPSSFSVPLVHHPDSGFSESQNGLLKL